MSLPHNNHVRFEGSSSPRVSAVLSASALVWLGSCSSPVRSAGLVPVRQHREPRAQRCRGTPRSQPAMVEAGPGARPASQREGALGEEVRLLE